jgi:hypothetical protein
VILGRALLDEPAVAHEERKLPVQLNLMVLHQTNESFANFQKIAGEFTT